MCEEIFLQMFLDFQSNNNKAKSLIDTKVIEVNTPYPVCVTLLVYSGLSSVLYSTSFV